MSFLTHLFMILTVTFAHADLPESCQTTLAPKSTTGIEAQVTQELRRQGFPARRIATLAALIGVIFADGKLTAMLNAQLPPDLSSVATQISIVVGVAVAAPFSGPLSAIVQQLSFRFMRDKNVPTAERKARDAYLNRLWLRMQENLNINQQIGSNRINAFLATAQPNFLEAHRRFEIEDFKYAAAQLAAVAYRQRTLYPDLAASDPSVAAEARLLLQPESLSPAQRAQVAGAVRAHLDAVDMEAPEDYYRQIFAAWGLD